MFYLCFVLSGLKSGYTPHGSQFLNKTTKLFNVTNINYSEE